VNDQIATPNIHRKTGSLVAWWCAFGVCLVVAIARTTDVNRSVLYAEDGRRFLQDWVENPSLQLIFTPYDGYLHFIPRLATGMVSLLPVDLWPAGCAIAASICLAAVGALVWILLRPSGLPWWCRVMLTAIPICLPLASVEPIGNLANFHWFVAYLMVFIAFARVENYRSAIGWGFVALCCALTEVQCALLLPVMAYRLIRHQHFRPVAIGWGVGMAAQTLAVVTSPRGYSAADSLDDTNTLRGYLTDVVAGSVTSKPETLTALFSSHGFDRLAIALAVYVAVCCLLAALGRGPWRFLVPGLLGLSAIAWLLTAVFGAGASSMTFDAEGAFVTRWGMAASMYLLAAGALALGVAALHLPKMKYAGVVALIITAVVWAPSFRSQLSYDGPSWEAEISEAQQSCELTPSQTPALDIAPEGWGMVVPCEDLG